MTDQVGIPSELVLLIEFRKFLNLPKTHLQENLASKDIQVVGTTTMTFYMNIKQTYKKAGSRYIIVDNGSKTQRRKKEDVEHGGGLYMFLAKVACSMSHRQAFFYAKLCSACPSKTFKLFSSPLLDG